MLPLWYVYTILEGMVHRNYFFFLGKWLAGTIFPLWYVHTIVEWGGIVHRNHNFKFSFLWT